jgi:hypothetical protein
LRVPDQGTVLLEGRDRDLDDLELGHRSGLPCRARRVNGRTVPAVLAGSRLPAMATVDGMLAKLAQRMASYGCPQADGSGNPILRLGWAILDALLLRGLQRPSHDLRFLLDHLEQHTRRDIRL